MKLEKFSGSREEQARALAKVMVGMYGEKMDEARESVYVGGRKADVNIAIMRTFVQLRRMMDSNRELARRVSEMEKSYDEQFRTVFQAIQELIAEENKPERKIGFQARDEDED